MLKTTALINAVSKLFVPCIEEMAYDISSHTLTCISSRSPATTVIWRKNGEVITDNGGRYKRTQVITITEIASSEYQNQLIGDFNIAGITCQVSNTIGSSQIYPIIGKIIL